MSHRTDVYETSDPWDVVDIWPGPRISIGHRTSSMIVGPIGVIDELKTGSVETPLTLHTESGRTYILRGRHRRGPNLGHCSIVGRDRPRTMRERLASRLGL